jgi:hypothetical protein
MPEENTTLTETAKEELLKEVESKKKIDVTDQERLANLSEHQLTFALKDIMYKLDVAEKRIVQEKDNAEVQKLETVTTNIRKSKDLLIAEFKRRGLKYSHINIDPENKCSFYKVCRRKIRSINEERKSDYLLSCYSCEFNTIEKRLPDPRNEFFIIRRADLERHHKQLKMTMSLAELEAHLVAMMIGPEEDLLVLALKDETAQVCALQFLQARYNQFMYKAMQAAQEAKDAGKLPATPTEQRQQQIIGAAIKDSVRNQRNNIVSGKPEVQDSKEVGEGSTGGVGNSSVGGRETEIGDGGIHQSGELASKPTDYKQGEGTDTEEKKTEASKSKEE